MVSSRCPWRWREVGPGHDDDAALGSGQTELVLRELPLLLNLYLILLVLPGRLDPEPQPAGRHASPGPLQRTDHAGAAVCPAAERQRHTVPGPLPPGSRRVGRDRIIAAVAGSTPLGDPRRRPTCPRSSTSTPGPGGAGGEGDGRTADRGPSDPVLIVRTRTYRVRSPGRARARTLPTARMCSPATNCFSLEGVNDTSGFPVPLLICPRRVIQSASSVELRKAPGLVRRPADDTAALGSTHDQGRR